MKRVLRSICIAITVVVLFTPALSSRAIGFDAESVYESVMVVHAGNSLGSGFSVGENCIITNAHVISRGGMILVSTYNGTFYDATVFACDEALDLAVLIVPGAHFPPLPVADYGACNIGDDIYTIGAPQSMTYTLTKGVVSAKRRIVGSQEYIQIDAAINGGNSGGPLLNDAGEVLGVNTMKMSDSEGIGLAIPMEVVRSFLIDCGIELDDKSMAVGTLPVPEPTPSIDVAEDSAGSIAPQSSKANSVLVLLLAVSVSLNIVLIIVSICGRRKKTAVITDPAERTDFEIEIEE